MDLNWNNIKYIIQIPIRWYKDIQDKIYHSYGTEFINIKHDGYNNGVQIGVDQDAFEQAVKSITGEGTTGYVKSVDGVAPQDEASGNVALGAVRSINNEYYPDSSGNVQIAYGDGRVKTVDNVEPDDDGNVDLGALVATDITTVGDTVGLDYEGEYTVCSPNHGHKVSDLVDIQDDDGKWMFVKSVNTTIKPDENGNINLNIPDSGQGFIVTSVDGVKATDVNGNVDLKAVRSITTGSGESASKLTPDAQGNINLGDIGEGSVKTVNNIEPDDDGNVDLGAIVHTVNDVEPDDNGNVNIGAVIENKATDVATTIVNNKISEEVPTMIDEGVKEYAAPIQHTHTHSDITDWAKETSAFFNVLDLTDEGETVGLSYTGDHRVCFPNHGHKLADITDFDDQIKDKLDDTFVTLDTAQTITGQKTFSTDVYVGSENKNVQLKADGINFNIEEGGLIFSHDSLNADAQIYFKAPEAIVEGGALVISNNNHKGIVDLTAPVNKVVLMNNPDGTVENAVATVKYVDDKLSPKVDNIEAVDGNIDLGAVRMTTDQTIAGVKLFTDTPVVGQSTSSGNRTQIKAGAEELYGSTPYIDFHYNNDAADYTSRIIDNGALTLKKATGQIKIDAAANYAVLANAPTGTVKAAIATVGYVGDNFGKVKSVNNVSPDSNGNVVIATGGTVKSVDNINPDSSGNVALGAVVTTKVETAGATVSPTTTYTRYVCPTAHGHNHDAIVDWDTATQSFVKSVDGVTPDENGAVSFGLAGSKWMKTDANGHIAVTTETPIAIDSSTYTPQSTTLTACQEVEWTGTLLRYKKMSYQFVNGVLVNVTDNGYTTIDTPTVITWG